MKRYPFLFVLALALPTGMGLRAEPVAADFSAVYTLLDERCVECHTTEDSEGGLVLETFEGLMKGGETGKSIEPGNSAGSLLIKYVRGEVEKDGKKLIMPPGKRTKLDSVEIALISRWIDSGAKPPLPGTERPRELKVAKITPKVPPRNAVNALAGAPGKALIAAGRFQSIELISTETGEVVRRLEGHRGNVNALVFSPDASRLFSASGENGLLGEVKVWNVADGALIRTIEGHRDTLYSLALSPDGKTLATGSYDQQVKLWNAETGAEIRTLRGHNGAVYGVAFRPDGRILASASADRTVKLWDVATGQRRDTLSQSLKELYTVVWSPDGKRVAAGGIDNRIRVWEVSAEAKETTNPIIFARFAHEAPILKLVWSADGATLLSGAQDQLVKLWDAAELRERRLLEKQSDWVAALTFAQDGATIVAGRQDGTLAFYNAKSGARENLRPAISEAAVSAARNVGGLPAKKPKKVVTPKVAPGTPVISRLEPRGIQRGVEATVKLVGSNLGGVTEVKASEPRIVVELIEAEDKDVTITVNAPADLKRGSYDLSAIGAEGKTIGTSKLLVDDLPQAFANSGTTTELKNLPVSIWGVLDKPGNSDRFEFEATAGQTLVFDLASKSISSKADAVLSLVDAGGKVLVSNNDFDSTGDPLVAYTFQKAGRYTVVVSELQFAGSSEHFYRLSAGELPFVTACFPLSVPANRESEVELIGYNLPAERKVKVAAGAIGEMPVPLDADKLRSRRGFKLAVSDLPHFTETEPNDTAERAMAITVPASVNGRIQPRARSTTSGAMQVSIPTTPVTQPVAAARDDQRRVEQVPEVSPRAPIVPTARKASPTRPQLDADLFRFDAKAGAVWVIETAAAQRGSPTDTKVEVLHPDGKPVERLLLQAVRDSAITFRPIDSVTNDARVDNWEEMELNQLIYFAGEVARIFRMPEGPDSGFQFYNINGKRQAYFNTTATAHSLDEPCYVVEAHPPGAKLIANGLPVFPLHYANDDDGDRKIGSDSRLLFTAPADDTYLVRVSDSRGMSGDRYTYRLIVRQAQPDYALNISIASPTVNAGSGQSFTVSADRKDGFDGAIDVAITGVPDGYKVSTPLQVEAGHQVAKGTLVALANAQTVAEAEWGKVKVSASAQIGGREVAHTFGGFGKITLGEPPKLYVAVEPVAPGDTLERLSPPTPLQEQDPGKPYEITIAPGEIVPAWIKIKRNGNAADLRFDVENLPHGVIVDNLGLNGITLLTGQSEGEIALKAAPWVQEMDRLCFATTRDASKQASLPVMLHVRKKSTGQTANAK